MRYYILLALCILLFSSCTKYEDTNKFTLNYFIEVTVIDTNFGFGSSRTHLFGGNIYYYVDTLTTTTAMSSDINLTRYNFYAQDFLLELYTPRSYYNFNGKSKVMKFSSDTSGINKNDTLYPGIQNIYALAFQSGSLGVISSIKYANTDSSYNNILKIEKEKNKENTYAVSGEFKLVTRSLVDSTWYFLVSGKYRLPFYTK